MPRERVQEVEEGLLFPRFRHILDVSATLTAQVLLDRPEQQDPKPSTLVSP